MEEYNAREQAAKAAGEGWANNLTSEQLSALLAGIDDDLAHAPPDDCTFSAFIPHEDGVHAHAHIEAYLTYIASSDIDPPSIDIGVFSSGETPTTFRGASKKPQIWEPAMRSEIKGLEGIGAWKLVPCKPGINVVGCKWAYAQKFDNIGTWKPKARLVAKGFQQIEGIDYFETYASVIRFDSFHAMCAIAAANNMEIGQADVEKAYLNAMPSETVYMDQPPGFVSEEHPNWVCEIQRALYGLMQSGNVWWKALDETWSDFGFQQSRTDENVCACRDEHGVLINGTYTDNILSFADTAEGLHASTNELKACFQLREGKAEYLLGLTIDHNCSNGTIQLSQQLYLEYVLDWFNMTNCNAVATPLEPGLKLSKRAMDPMEAEIAIMNTIPYKEALGSIMYLGVATHPDLSYPIQVLSRHMANHGIEHWAALKHVLHYLKGTSNYSITYYRAGMSTASGPSTIEPVLYSDSLFADCPDSAQSTHGYVAIMAGGPISWSLCRQDVVALSTMEAEYIAAVHCAQTGLWLEKFMHDVLLPIHLPIVLYMDSSSGESLATKLANFTRVRHLHVRFHWLRDAICSKQIRIQHVAGAENPSDIFTKALSFPILSTHLTFLGVAA